jgi:gamma-glutamyltranspeptidase / glutathione hydrolase
MPLQPMITGARHMISAGHYLATEAGHAVLQAGGNAVDAGVAAGIALGVVHSDQVQFSGVAPMIIYLADRDEVITISGLGGWPKAARLETFVEDMGARSRRASSARWCPPPLTPGFSRWSDSAP